MEVSIYDVIYLLTNAFEVYLLFSFMKLFFGNTAVNKRVAILTYSFFYVVTSIIYLVFSTMALNMISSLVTTFAVTLSYKSKLSKRLIATALNYLMLCTCEAIVAFGVGVSGIDPLKSTRYGDSFSPIIVELLAFVFIRIIGRFRNFSGDVPLPWSFFAAAILVPIISVMLELQLFMQSDVSSAVYALSLVLVLALNFVMFYLYDSIYKNFNEKIQTEMAQKSAEYYQKQAELIAQNAEEVKRLRHDMKNHIIAISELAKAKSDDEILDYISGLSANLEAAREFSSTGIVTADSVINHKLTRAENIGISVTADIAIPNSLKIKADDFVVILGNLLDNALEAASKLSTGKYIKLTVRYGKGALLVTVKNSFDGTLNIQNGGLKTTKKADPTLHGIGLKSIRSSVEKYNGEMSISHTDNEFCVKVILMV